MARDERLGDKMPDRRSVKWGEMKHGESHLSDEWHDMVPSEPKMSEKWVDIEPSSPRMSERWVEIEAGESKLSDKWHEMRQEKRVDPYAMHSSDGDRTQPFKPMAKEKPDNKAERASQHTEFGKTREI